MIRHSWFGYALLSGALLLLMSEVCGALVPVKDEVQSMEQTAEKQEEELTERHDEVAENELKLPEFEVTELQETKQSESEPEELPEVEAVVGGRLMVEPGEPSQEVGEPSREEENPTQEVQMSVGNAASVVVTDEYQIYTEGDKVEYLPLP